jgi:hypothetical protein
MCGGNISDYHRLTIHKLGNLRWLHNLASERHAGCGIIHDDIFGVDVDPIFIIRVLFGSRSRPAILKGGASNALAQRSKFSGGLGRKGYVDLEGQELFRKRWRHS